MKIRYMIYALLLTIAVVGQCYADKLSSYPYVSTLSNANTIPIITPSANENINWYSLKELMSKNINWQDVQGTIPATSINWTSIELYSCAHGGCKSGINWTAFGV